MLSHDTGRGVFDTGIDPGFLEVLEKHPENSDRVKNMVSILKRGPISPYISWHSGRPANIPELLSFHSQVRVDVWFDKGYQYAMMELVVPAVNNFEPDMMVLVIGQDSSAFDPNGRQCLTMDGYRETGRIVRSLAEKHSVHATLEGVLNPTLPLLEGNPEEYRSFIEERLIQNEKYP